jgi:hypothetical protein
MRILALTLLVAAACGGAPKKADPKADQVESDTCCCKSNPATSEDGKAVFAVANRMECSTKQGSCVGENECTVTPPAE